MAARWMLAGLGLVPRHCRHVALILGISLLFGSDVPRPQESSTYSIERITLSSGAGRASSARFDAILTTGQGEPAGAASFCNAGFGVTLGFWSALGEMPVANWLLLNRNAQDPTRVDLTWSGSAQSFEVYRGSSAATILDPGNLYLTTTSCAASDAVPLVGRVVYYDVVPAGN